MSISIYTISCPLSGLVRYVGKTCNERERFRKHLTENNGTKKARWIKGLRTKGLKPVFETIDTCTQDKWQEKERAYIKLFKSIGANLLNEMPGGEGGATMKGKKLTPEQRLKIAISKIGKKRAWLSEYNKANKSVRVKQYDLNGNFICEHESISAAANHIGRDPARINRMISGVGKTVNHVGGYRFTAA